MTREEAKRRIEICRDFLANNYSDMGEPNFTAFNMAIKALSQEPTDENLHREREQAYMQGYEDASNRFRQEPCDDAISRKAVNTLVDELARAISDERCHIPQRGRSTGHIMHDILDLPSVTQKSGKWILLDECANSGYYCSNCQKKLVKEGWSQTVKKIKYCPNCGARMESEE